MSVTEDLQIREWIDHLAIQDLIYRYSSAVTRGDLDQLAAVFAPDAIWESPALGEQYRFENAKAFLEFFAEGTSARASLDQNNPRTAVSS